MAGDRRRRQLESLRGRHGDLRRADPGISPWRQVVTISLRAKAGRADPRARPGGLRAARARALRRIRHSELNASHPACCASLQAARALLPARAPTDPALWVCARLRVGDRSRVASHLLSGYRAAMKRTASSGHSKYRSAVGREQKTAYLVPEGGRSITCTSTSSAPLGSPSRPPSVRLRVPQIQSARPLAEDLAASVRDSRSS